MCHVTVYGVWRRQIKMRTNDGRFRLRIIGVTAGTCLLACNGRVYKYRCAFASHATTRAYGVNRCYSIYGTRCWTVALLPVAQPRGWTLGPDLLSLNQGSATSGPRSGSGQWNANFCTPSTHCTWLWYYLLTKKKKNVYIII